jgi:aryl-alcohol dehydrogenase-like predicted oxidoreductase
LDDDFLRGTLGRTGIPVHRLGLAASHRPGERTVQRALDEGVNYFFCFGIDGQMIRVLRRLPPDRRERVVIAATTPHTAAPRRRSSRTWRRTTRDW